MKIAQYSVVTVAVVMLALIGIGYILPSSTHVERVRYIKAAPETVYANIIHP